MPFQHVSRTFRVSSTELRVHRDREVQLCPEDLAQLLPPKQTDQYQDSGEVQGQMWVRGTVAEAARTPACAGKRVWV